MVSVSPIPDRASSGINVAAVDRIGRLTISSRTRKLRASGAWES
jgi:hypothetical protein